MERAIHVDPFGDEAARRATARRGITVLDVEALRRDADERRARAAAKADHPSKSEDPLVRSAWYATRHKV